MATKVIFIHIPKTGGTSLYHTLYHQYPVLGVLHYLDHQYGDLSGVRDDFREQDFLQLPKWLKRRVQVHGGHMPFGFHRALTEPFQYISFIREPVARVVAGYRHVANHSHHPSHALLQRENISLGDFVQDPRFLEGQNFMTRMLSGTLQNIEVTEQHFQQAIDNIEQNNMIIGLMEDHLNSVLLMAVRLGWERPIVVTHANKGLGAKKSLGEEALEVIQAHNVYDIRLYAYLKNRYEGHLQENQAGIEAFRGRIVAESQWLSGRYWLKSKVVRVVNLWLASKR